MPEFGMSAGRNGDQRTRGLLLFCQPVASEKKLQEDGQNFKKERFREYLCLSVLRRGRGGGDVMETHRNLWKFIEIKLLFAENN